MQTREPEALVRPCPQCGAESPPNFTVCWRCQADLPPVDPGAAQPEPEPEPREVPAAEPRLSPREQGALILEVVIVQLVAWAWEVPWRLWLQLGPPENPPAVPAATIWMMTTILFDIGVAALLLYLIWRTAGSLEPAGLVRARWWTEPLAAAALLVAAGIVVRIAAIVADGIQLPRSPSDVPLEESKPALFPIFVLAAALLEEVCFRAYLITRLTQLLRRGGRAVLLSAIVFALYHLPSPARGLELFVVGLLFGAVFLTWRRLPRLVLAHWVWNLAMS